MSGPHTSELGVRFYELDPYGHVNHTVYIAYFETARIEMLDAIGFSLGAMLEAGVQFVVTGIATRFLGSAVYGDSLIVETGVVDVGRVRCTWAQRIRRADEVLVTQRVQFATTNTAGRPRRLPEGLADAMEPFSVSDHWLGQPAL